MAKFNIIIADKAFQMLDEHVMFLAKVSSRAAHRLRQSFVNKVKSLDNNSTRYPLWQPDFILPKSYHKILIKKRYLIIFYIEKNNIYVDYFLDCRMDSTIIF